LSLCYSQRVVGPASRAREMDNQFQIGEVTLEYPTFSGCGTSPLNPLATEETDDSRIDDCSPKWSILGEFQYYQVATKMSSVDIQGHVEPSENDLRKMRSNDPDLSRLFDSNIARGAIHSSTDKHQSANSVSNQYRQEGDVLLTPTSAALKEGLHSFSPNRESNATDMDRKAELEHLEALLGSIESANSLDYANNEPHFGANSMGCSPDLPVSETSRARNDLECFSPPSDFCSLLPSQQDVPAVSETDAVQRLNGLYSCLHCNLQFRQTGNLRKHVQEIHERRKPFPCSLCDISFSRKHARDTHERAVYVYSGQAIWIAAPFCQHSIADSNKR
jgi:hypothetical protein